MELFNGKQFILLVYTVLKRHYPGFEQLLNSIPDHRRRRTYSVAEILMAGLFMFVFKRGSRNNTDNFFTAGTEENVVRLFGLRLPLMDSVDVFLRSLPPCELEKLKQSLVRQLVEKKALEKFRFNGRYVVAIDGTGVYSFDHEPFEGCPHKTSKNGKVTWQAYVLEAKLVCANGFSISLASEWLLNSDNINEKQDCELKAFTRLSGKLKKMYPRLPMIIAADSLYPNNRVFDICKKNGWRFILTFKEGSLKSVWEEAMSLYPLCTTTNRQQRIVGKNTKGWEEESLMHVLGIQYQKHFLNWIEYQRWYSGDPGTKTRFVHLTDMGVSKDNAWEVSFHGRLRWKIENEGFNAQKNLGYGMQHKYSRKHLGAMQNYYELLQIAHLIVQLTKLLKSVREALVASGVTLKALWDDMVASMRKETIMESEAQHSYQKIKQLRY